MDKKITPKDAALAVLKKAEDMLKSSKLTKADEKGVHPVTHEKGKSSAGMHAASSEKTQFSTQSAKAKHKQVLGELKAMPKPNLTKQEEAADVTPEQGVKHSGKGVHKLSKFMGHREEKRKPKVNGNPEQPMAQVPIQAVSAPLEKGQNDGTHADNHSNNYDDVKASKGVNKVLPKYDKKTSSVKHGSSEMGNQVEKKNMGAAKETAKATLSEIKAQPKPNLTKGDK